MHRYQIIHSLIHAAIAALLLLFFKNFNDLSTTFQGFLSRESSQWLLLALVPALAWLFKVSDNLARFLIEKVPALSPLLRRTLAGKDFIEGDWPLVVVNAKTGALVYLGYLTISHVDSQPYVKGMDWYPDGRPVFEFHSEQSRYSDGRLQYWYVQGENDSMRGFTEIYFFPRNSRVQRHAGEFLDKQNIDMRFYAFRLKPKKRNEQQKIEEAKKVWAALEPNMPKIVARVISIDWE